MSSTKMTNYLVKSKFDDQTLHTSGLNSKLQDLISMTRELTHNKIVTFSFQYNFNYFVYFSIAQSK